jgi:CRP-like cAMP-binding protein
MRIDATLVFSDKASLAPFLRKLNMISPETLRSYRLFAKQSNYMLEEIALLAKRIELEQGDWLFHEQEYASHLYLISEGAISLCLNLYWNGSCQHVEATSPLGAYEVLGWSAIVKPHIYTFGARAENKSRLIAIDAEPLRELLDDNPAFGYYFLKNLSEVIGDRLTSKCVQLLSLVLDSDGAPIMKQSYS